MAPRGDSSAALALAVAQGMIGGDLDQHVAHAHGFAAAYAQLSDTPPTRVVDLGSGGGLPAFILIERWPLAEFLLVEGRSKRAELLGRGIRLMGVHDRVEVHAGDAQIAMTTPAWLQQADLVTARAFASPAITAECASQFLAEGAYALISEPPDQAITDRWPTEALATVGLTPQPLSADGHQYVALHKTDAPSLSPRSRRSMEKSPLY